MKFKSMFSKTQVRFWKLTSYVFETRKIIEVQVYPDDTERFRKFANSFGIREAFPDTRSDHVILLTKDLIWYVETYLENGDKNIMKHYISISLTQETTLEKIILWPKMWLFYAKEMLKPDMPPP